VAEPTPDSPLDAATRRAVAVFKLQAAHGPNWSAAHELTFGQLRLLFLLQGDGPMPMSHVAERIGVGVSAVTGIVERIERQGLVERCHRADDRRVVECCLTEAGEQFVGEFAGIRMQTTRRLLSSLNAEELAQLDHLLGLVLERADRARD
jgi:DNA-binding MarR family transcriptional regulator